MNFSRGVKMRTNREGEDKGINPSPVRSSKCKLIYCFIGASYKFSWSNKSWTCRNFSNGSAYHANRRVGREDELDTQHRQRDGHPQADALGCPEKTKLSRNHFFNPSILIIWLRESPGKISETYHTPSYQSWLPLFWPKMRPKYKANCRIVSISFLLAITFTKCKNQFNFLTGNLQFPLSSNRHPIWPHLWSYIWP